VIQPIFIKITLVHEMGKSQETQNWFETRWENIEGQLGFLKVKLSFFNRIKCLAISNRPGT